MKYTRTLLIRTDADVRIGTGHVMRCLALAEAWQDVGGDVVFVSALDSSVLDERLRKEGMGIIHISPEAGTSDDADETTRIASEHGVRWIVVDGYQFGAEYQKRIKDKEFSLLFIDDYGHVGQYYADIVLNQNIYADMSFYKNYEPYTRFLIGLKYVLIRREFLERSGHNRTTPEIARRILITLGGSDPDNITLGVIEGVKTTDVRDLQVIVVVGGANPHVERILEAVNAHPYIRLVKNADNMPELMAWADVAISAGGSTCWELLFMGLPSLVIPIAENQIPVVNKLHSLGIVKAIDINEVKIPEKLALVLSAFLQSREIRSRFSERMVQYIDGHGPSRILSAMEKTRLTLRNVEQSDCKRIWQWINDPLVRSVSFETGPISLECHKAWFSSSLGDPGLVYYIALDHNARAIGQARFTITLREAVISVLVDSRYRGMSLGSQLINDATEKLFNETGIEKVNALIKTGNEISRKAFIKAGYKEHGLTEYSGENAYLFIKMRGE